MPSNRAIARFLKNSYTKLYAHFGPQYWWPADNQFEVIIGAILTQNTAWSNVEKAISGLKRHKFLKPEKIYRSKISTLAKLIRPCGYYNLKALRIKNFIKVLFSEYQGKLSLLLSLSPKLLRKKLLQINGIGPETADSIILYAANKPVFVVDAYTRRFLTRHQLVQEQDSYQDIQSLLEGNLPRNLKLFNEYHALIVRLAKQFCRVRPVCDICPLQGKEDGPRQQKWK